MGITTIRYLCNQKLNSDKLSCLQNTSLNNLISITAEIDRIVLDNIVFDETITEMMSQDKFKKCNIITGANSKEVALFLVLEKQYTLNKDQFQNKMDNYIMNSMVEVTIPMKWSMKLEYVNTSAYPKYPIDYTRDFIAMQSDQMFSCPAFSIADAYSKAGNKAYVYEDDFIANSSTLKGYGGVVHGEELYQVFGEALSNKVMYFSVM